MIALLMRLAIILVAGVGILFYWINHREVQQLLREAERLADQSEVDCRDQRSAMTVSTNN